MKSLSILSTSEVRDIFLTLLCLSLNILMAYGMHNFSQSYASNNPYLKVTLIVVLSFAFLLNIYCFNKIFGKKSN